MIIFIIDYFPFNHTRWGKSEKNALRIEFSCLDFHLYGNARCKQIIEGYIIEQQENNSGHE